ncbi:MAG: YlmC/YmxH family sporulation protein [Firmicutes bacterium]|nr:YlmC/YmxH family sporulation protein [Bacillota bacterium]
MYIKTSELRQLDVINIEDGRFLGHVCDVDLHPDTGAIRCLILEGSEGGLLRFFKHDDIEIPWQEVVMIGIDVVIVKTEVGKAKSYAYRTWRR